MQRFFASALLAMLSFLLLAPLAATVDADATLPACCRANGKHRCMMLKMRSHAGVSVTAISDKCPFLSSVVGSIPVAAITQREEAPAGLFAHPSSSEQIEARYRVAERGARQKRGPPSLFS